MRKKSIRDNADVVILVEPTFLLITISGFQKILDYSNKTSQNNE